MNLAMKEENDKMKMLKEENEMLNGKLEILQESHDEAMDTSKQGMYEK